MANTSSLAQLYENHSALQHGYGKSLIISHLGPGEGEKILDLGSGTGRLSKDIADILGHEGEVLGVDPNTERIEVAKVHYERHLSNGAKVKFMTDLVHDAVPHGPFDAVFSNFALHWVPDDDMNATMSSIERCLKTGGRLCANITLTTGPYANDLSLMATGQSEEVITGMNFRSLDFWTNQCRTMGLEVQFAQQDDDMVVSFKTVREYFEFVKAYTEGGVDYGKLSSEQLTAFIASHDMGSLDSELVYRSAMLTVVASKPDSAVIKF
ncbi:arsenite methyltransferase-like [Sycon ciliatum]|uniref:arsenite methyltransferase-like n=1 Tax=Sycon ciliatum TaxID=27933 RepID=UPI0031F62EBC